MATGIRTGTMRHSVPAREVDGVIFTVKVASYKEHAKVRAKACECASRLVGYTGFTPYAERHYVCLGSESEVLMLKLSHQVDVQVPHMLPDTLEFFIVDYTD